jgi:rhodanese-related sulfurtransferase
MDPVRKRLFKDEVFGQFARIGQALSSGRRLELIDLLAQGERTVEDLARETDMSTANASQHLQVLRRVRLVDSRQEGTYVFYRLMDVDAFRLWQAVRTFGRRQLSDIDRIVNDFLDQREELEPIRMAELVDRMRVGEVILLDVRPRSEYDAGHIAGAQSVPLEELDKVEIPEGREVVAYCRGPFCVYADEAVARLREIGIQAYRLEAGFPDWSAAGLPTGRHEVKSK